MKLASTLVAAAAAAVPMFANALPPGQYDIAGIQQICLVGDGTWYGTTFPAWGGHYEMRYPKTFIYGNYAGGAGNDSMVFYGNHRGPWTEWRDDFSWEAVSVNLLITFVKPDCDPPPFATESDGNPLVQR
jgi:hypothetical protein